MHDNADEVFKHTMVSFVLTFLGIRSYLKVKSEIRAFRKKKLKLLDNCKSKIKQPFLSKFS
jgi:hypothetical protein